MPRGTSRYDEARLQGRLWAPSGGSAVGFDPPRDLLAAYFNGTSSVKGNLTSLARIATASSARAQRLRVFVTLAAGIKYAVAVIPLRNLTLGESYDVSLNVVEVSTNAAYARVCTDDQGQNIGSVYNSGDVGVGALSTTFLPAVATYYLALFYDTELADGYADFANIRVCKTSASTTQKNVSDGFWNHWLGIAGGLDATHPYRNAPPLIGV